jgi:uncharacterized UBP type Zn finger protein
MDGRQSWQKLGMKLEPAATKSTSVFKMSRSVLHACGHAPFLPMSFSLTLVGDAHCHHAQLAMLLLSCLHCAVHCFRHAAPDG